MQMHEYPITKRIIEIAEEFAKNIQEPREQNVPRETFGGDSDGQLHDATTGNH